VIDHSPDTFQIPDRPSKARFGKKPGHGFGPDRPTCSIFDQRRRPPFLAKVTARPLSHIAE
jgi:hypothetical protein